MKSKFLLILALSFIFYNSVKAQTIDTTACRLVEEYLTIIDKFLKDEKSIMPNLRQKAVVFLSGLTGITSESDIDYFGQMFPTKNDFYYWSRWYYRNKVNLNFDKGKNSIIVHKEVLL